MVMSSAFSIDVAGICMTLTCYHNRLSQVLNQRYRSFLTGGKTQFTINITWEKTTTLPVFVPPDISYDDYGVRLTNPGFVGYGDLVRRRADVTVGNVTPVESVDYFLRVVIALLIFEAQGIMVHGAGILHEGFGYLFFGHSGSGKTTLSRSSVDDVVLNDDLVVLMPMKKGWRMYSTPFWNPTQIEPKPISTPLTAMYRLVQDESVYITPFKPGQALAELMANIPIIASDIKRSKLLLERCVILLQKTPAYELHFLPDNTFWQMINAQRESS